MAAEVLEAEFKENFLKTQDRLLDLERQTSHCLFEIETRQKRSKLAHVTLLELEQLKKEEQQSELNTYISIGKMFMKMPLNAVVKDLKEQKEKDERDLVVLSKTGEYLQTALDQEKKQMLELMEKSSQ